MSDLPDDRWLEQRLGQLATADRLKALSDRVDEYRVRSRAELAQVAEVVGTLARALDVVLRDQQALAEEVRKGGAADAGPGHEALERLTAAVGALRDDLAQAHERLTEDTRAAVERIAGQQAERAVRLLEAVGEAGDRTVAAIGTIGGDGTGTEAVAEVVADLRQLRTTLDGRHVVLTEAVAGVREELLAGLTELRAATAAAAVATAPEVPAYDDSDVRSALGGLRDDLRRLQGELLETTGQLRTDMAARDTSLRDEIVGAVERRLADVPVDVAAPVQGIYDRLGGIEWRLGERLDPLVDRLSAIEARLDALGQPPVETPDRAISEGLASLRAGLEQVAQRDDLRRGVERVLGAVSNAEEAVSGEIRAVDARVGALADDVRLVRVLRDGLEALAASVDGVRQVASRSATSQQMTDVTRELGAVLAEIESARSQVLRVEQSTSPVAAEVVAVGSDVDDLGHRIDMLAEVIEAGMHRTPPGESDLVQQMAQRLRQASTSARVLGSGVLEDLRSRRGRRR